VHSENLESERQPPPLKRFKLLAQDTRTQTTSSARAAAVGIYAELECYTTEAGDSGDAGVAGICREGVLGVW